MSKTLEQTIKNLYRIQQANQLQSDEQNALTEDGHVDVASSIRKCKTAAEDAIQIMNKLQSMDPEGSLPTWWTNKLAVACMSLNKLRDYLLVSSESVTEKKHLDPVNPKAVKKDFKDRKDKDIDNDGDTDDTDKYLHKRRKAISKAIKGEEVEVKEVRPQGKTFFQGLNKRKQMGVKPNQKRVDAFKKSMFSKKNVQSQKDEIDLQPKLKDTYEAKVAIPDKTKDKLDDIVKALKKSVGAHAKQHKTISKLTKQDKPDIKEKHGGDHMSTGRKMTDAEMKKREDIKKGLMKTKSDFKKRYGDDADQVMNALATKKAMESTELDEISRGTLSRYSAKASDASRNRNLPINKRDNRVAGVKKASDKMSKMAYKALKKEDIVRKADVKVVKVRDPMTGQMRFKRTRPETQSSKFNEEMNYKVSIEGLPDFFVNANNPGEVKLKMRKMLKKPDMLSKVARVPDAAMKKHFRLKAQGKDDEPQTQEEQVMSEDHNPLVKAVSDVLSSGRSNMFRSVNKLDEKLSSKEKMKRGLYNQKGVMPAPKGMADKSPGDQDGGAKAALSKNVTMKAKGQDKKIPQGASTLHMCAKNVMHEKYGRGECLYGMHAEADENGHVSHYDIMFNHGIEKDMPIAECKVLHERMHGHKKKEK